jgi:PmbA protein
MLNPTQAQDRAAALIDMARAAGADAADAVYAGSSSESVGVRLGQLEDVERSESESLDLRVFVGQRSASIGSSDLSEAALKELAARAVDMARAAPEDQYAGFAAEELLFKGTFPDLAQRNFALVTSHGFAGSFGGTMHGISATAIAGEGSGMQRDYAWRMAHHLEDLPSLHEIGHQAGTRAVHRLEPGRVKSGQMPVVFDPRVGGSLVSHLIGAISGNAIARRASFLLDHEDDQIFAAGITIHDDPLRRRGLSSRPFDGEGLATAPRALVQSGKLTGWLMDSAAARQLGAPTPTGHAVRGAGGSPGVGASNVHLEAGSLSVAELIADIEEGVFVTELIGHGVNGVTGDYSRGASGLRIVKGELAGPVAEFTVAGNLLDMYRQLAVANDLEWHRTVNVPTIRVDGMTVAGD